MRWKDTRQQSHTTADARCCWDLQDQKKEESCGSYVGSEVVGGTTSKRDERRELLPETSLRVSFLIERNRPLVVSAGVGQ